MTMGDESPVSSLVLPVLIRPILDKLEHKDKSACQTLRTALTKEIVENHGRVHFLTNQSQVELAHPGFTHDLIVGLMRKADLSVNMNESVLRLQGSVSESDEFKSNRLEDIFQELNRKSVSLKKILSRIPDEINDRKTFLETIKEIASAIKKLLDAVNEVSGYILGQAGKQALDQRKREFVKYSKKFSNTLKDYFREGQATAVFISATYLIHHTNLIMTTVIQWCE